ncbi:SDR family NAD(P)-dependent oxidoreductase [Agromyces sp. SYSU T0242]|uniref:SDR family NAD(P)-dependent oxidoreductase n=1 Tax=Agromyces litoreus TaxID=3158561 RepID=UPI003395E901
MMKTVLITGCSTGLGVAVAVGAARAGHAVYATMRDLGRRGALDAAAAEAGVEVHVRALDVQHRASIDSVVAEIIDTEGRIDVVVNNAGIGFVRTLEHATEDEIQRVVDINQLGVMRCTQAVLPHLRRQRSGHVIVVSSVGGLVGQPFNEIYCATKFAVEGFIEGLASYVGPTFGIDFSVIEPGGISSAFAANVMADLQASGGLGSEEYQEMFARYRDAVASTPWEHPVSQTPEEVAEVVLEVMEAEEPPIRRRTSPWAEQVTELKTGLDPDGRRLQRQVMADFFGMR